MTPQMVLPTLSGDVTTKSWSTGTAQTVPVPPNLKDGDTVTVLGLCQVAGSTLSMTGFTAQYHTTAATTRGFYIFTRKVTNAASDLAGVNYAITQSNSGRGGAMASRNPIASATPIDGAPTSDYIAPGAGTNIAIPGITVTHPDADVLLCWFANGTGGALATASATGYTSIGTPPTVDVSGSTSTLGILQGNPGTGPTGTINVTLSVSMASFGGFAISMLPTPAPVGIASAEAFGNPSLTILGGLSPTGIASAEAFGAPTIISNQTLSPAGIPSAQAFGTAKVPTWVDQWWAQPTPAAAHRNGCWGTYGECTLAGYAFAAAWSPNLAMEVPVWPTTDGVWVLSHDQNTSRVFSGTGVDINTVTWASISSKTTLVGGNPIARLDDLLAAQATGTRVFIVDNKSQASNSALLDLLDSYGGPARFIAQAFITSTTWANAAGARGYPKWGYGYQADVTRTSDSVIGGTPNNFSVNQSIFTYLGMDQTANSASWTYALSFGKLILSNELATAAQKANALSLGATAIMASDITQTVPNVLTLSPTGIASAQAFGSDTVTPGPVTLSPTGIASAGAFGSDTVTPGPVTLSPVGVASAEAFGTAVVTPGPVSISPAGIATVEAFGTTVVTPGAVSIAPAGIASAEALGSSTITTGPVSISPAGIATAEAVGSHTVGRGAVSISPTGIATAEGFGADTVSPGPVSISPAGIASSEIFGAASVQLGALAPTGIASAQAFGTTVITTGATSLAPTGISSGEAFGGTVILTGASLIQPVGITSGEGFGSAVISVGAVSISPTGIATGEAFGSDTVSSKITLSPTGIASGEVLGSTVVNAGSVTTSPTGIASAEALGNPSLTVGGVSLSPTGISSAEAFGPALISSGGVFLVSTGIGSAEGLGNPTLTTGPVSISPTGISTAQAFGNSSVGAGAVTLTPSGIASAEAVGVATLTVGTAIITPSGITSGEAFGAPQVNAGSVSIAPAGISSGEALGVPSLTLGAASIRPSGISSTESFGIATIIPGGTSLSPVGVVSTESFGTARVKAFGITNHLEVTWTVQIDELVWSGDITDRLQFNIGSIETLVFSYGGTL